MPVPSQGKGRGMDLAGTPLSYWTETTRTPPYAPLTDDVEVDVAVVGGGIAGLSVAWEVLRTGRRVAVLEAGRIAAAVTGHTTAKVSSLHTLIYAHLERSAGADTARLYAESQQDAVEHLGRTARELGIDCDWEERASNTYAESADRAGEIRDAAQAAARAGLPATVVAGTGLPFAVAGAGRGDGQAQFHPRRCLLGLAGAIVDGGGTVHEHTRVRGLTEGRPCRLTTEDGHVVRADDVV